MAQNEWIELGVIQSAAEMNSNPVVVRVSRNSKTGYLSYEFGLLASGKVQVIRHWGENRIYSLATLVKAAAALALSSNLTGADITAAQFERLVEREPMLRLVKDHFSAAQEQQNRRNKNFGASIGTRLRGKR
jgi:hypothetical protein